MKRILSYIIFLPIILLLFIAIITITCPPLLEPFLGALNIYWTVFRNLFLADTIRKIIVIVVVTTIFGGLALRKQNAIIGFITAILDLVFLFA